MVMQDNNLVFDWFDDKFNIFQDIVKLPDSFIKAPIPKDYSNVLTDLHSCVNKLKKSMVQINHGLLPDMDVEDKMYRTHKYKLSFTADQIKILDSYFNECTIL